MTNELLGVAMSDIPKVMEEMINDPDLQFVMISNKVRRRMGLSPKKLHREGFILHRGLPGAVMVFAFDRAKDSVKISAFDPEGCAWAMAWMADPDFDFLMDPGS